MEIGGELYVGCKPNEKGGIEKSNYIGFHQIKMEDEAGSIKAGGDCHFYSYSGNGSGLLFDRGNLELKGDLYWESISPDETFIMSKDFEKIFSGKNQRLVNADYTGSRGRLGKVTVTGGKLTLDGKKLYIAELETDLVLKGNVSNLAIGNWNGKSVTVDGNLSLITGTTLTAGSSLKVSGDLQQSGTMALGAGGGLQVGGDYQLGSGTLQVPDSAVVTVGKNVVAAGTGSSSLAKIILDGKLTTQGSFVGNNYAHLELCNAKSELKVTGDMDMSSRGKLTAGNIQVGGAYHCDIPLNGANFQQIAGADSENPGSEIQDTESSQNTENSGNSSEKAETTDSEASGTETAGSETSGTENRGSETADSQTADSETSGTETDKTTESSETSSEVASEIPEVKNSETRGTESAEGTGNSENPGTPSQPKGPQKPQGGQSGNSGQTGAPESGEEISDDIVVYKVLKTEKTVSYVQNKAGGSIVKIDDTVTIDGITYQVTEVANNALKGNKQVKQITVGKNVTTIGTSAFEGCTRLKTLRLGSKVTKIKANACKGCIALTKVTVPNKVVSIGDAAFLGCKNLKTVTIGTGLKKIGKRAFEGCKKLSSVTIKSTKLKGVGKNALKNIAPKAKIKVPAKKLGDYQKMLGKKGQGSNVKIVK